MLKLKIENIGIIKECEIELDKITVIAGENDTGKSTIGKTLFGLIKSFREFNNFRFENLKEVIVDETR